jgi:hypothetical protein
MIAARPVRGQRKPADPVECHQRVCQRRNDVRDLRQQVLRRDPSWAATGSALSSRPCGNAHGASTGPALGERGLVVASWPKYTATPAKDAVYTFVLNYDVHERICVREPLGTTVGGGARTRASRASAGTPSPQATLHSGTISSTGPIDARARLQS